MAANYAKVPVRFIVFISFFYVLLQFSSSQPDVKVNVSPLRELIRNRRQACPDGTYEHEGRVCCLCAAGQYIKEHCSSNRDDRVCSHCPSGTYNTDPNNFETCRLCTSCSQPNANLEVAEPCTIARDTKCRCKEGHYCNSNTESCKICQPCTKCSTSIKETCTATSDTVCKEPEGNQTGAIVGSIFGILAIVIVAGVAFMYWRKRKAGKTTQTPSQTTDNNNGVDEERQPCIDMIQIFPQFDIQPLLPDISEELEWKDVERLALQSRISNAAIQSCKADHPGNSQEQTYQLLTKWMETQGMNASNILVQNLLKNSQKTKAEKIQNILRRHLRSDA